MGRKGVSKVTPTAQTQERESQKVGEGEGGGNLQTQGNVAITIVVVLLEHIRHALQTDASLDEQIEAEALGAAYIVAAPANIPGKSAEE